MPRYSVSTDIAAPVGRVFAEVSDLCRHPAWAADQLVITAVDEGPVAVGKIYRSSVVAKGKTITADLEVTAYESPYRFEFVAMDLTGHYVHEFLLDSRGGSTRAVRTVQATLDWRERLLFLLVFRLVKLPNTKRAMRRLAQRCAATGS